jgi:hypothetical protein
LRKRFEHDKARQAADKKKKEEENAKNEAREAQRANRTRLDDDIDDVDADERRLIRDKYALQEDREDFEKLKALVLRREVHDLKKSRRRQKREYGERLGRKQEWDEIGGSVKPVAGDTVESLKKVLDGLEDVALEYETSYYDEEKEPEREWDPDLDFETLNESAAEWPDVAGWDSDPDERQREKTVLEIEMKREMREVARRRVDPNYDLKGEQVMRKVTHSPRDNPKVIWAERFRSFKDRDVDERMSRKNRKTENPDDNVPAGEREVQDSEMDEGL